MPAARRPTIVGVINLSPESNVPGSHAAGVPAVRKRAAALCADGADYVELGARSISHDRAPIDDAEEWRRLRPALDALVAAGYRVAVDTWSETCATAALAGGACFVNFTGAWPSAELCGAVAASGATLCALYLPYADPYQMPRPPAGELPGCGHPEPVPRAARARPRRRAGPPGARPPTSASSTPPSTTPPRSPTRCRR